MLLKQQDPMMLEKKVITTPVDYAALNQLSQDFETQFVPQTELSAEQAFWSQNSMDSSYPNPSCRPTKVEVPKELPIVSMEKDVVITALKNELRKLKGKDLVETVVTKHPFTPEMLKVDVEPIAPRLLNNSTAHSDYLRHTHEQAAILIEIHSKLNANFELLCVKCNGCMLSDNHDLCVLDFVNDVNARNKSKSIKKSSKRKFGNQQEKITTTAKVSLKKPTALESDTPKPVVTLVYSRKPKKSKTNVPISKPKNIKSLSANKKEPSNSWRSIFSDVPSSSLDECRSSKLFSEGVDLLTGSRGNNQYTLSLRDMMASSLICLLSKASKTKSWLWHRRPSHPNFGAINHLARHGLVRGLPKLKFEKDHLCSACAMGKSKKKPYKPKSEDTNQEKLYLLHMDLYGPMRVTSVNGKKYILVIVDDYS
ncbi:retrovirus-related pol polyprotein from transposon TNT 1-94 [Tanacetum coccineum]